MTTNLSVNHNSSSPFSSPFLAPLMKAEPKNPDLEALSKVGLELKMMKAFIHFVKKIDPGLKSSFTQATYLSLLDRTKHLGYSSKNPPLLHLMAERRITCIGLYMKWREHAQDLSCKADGPKLFRMRESLIQMMQFKKAVIEKDRHFTNEQVRELFNALMDKSKEMVCEIANPPLLHEFAGQQIEILKQYLRWVKRQLPEETGADERPRSRSRSPLLMNPTPAIKPLGLKSQTSPDLVPAFLSIPSLQDLGGEPAMYGKQRKKKRHNVSFY